MLMHVFQQTNDPFRKGGIAEEFNSTPESERKNFMLLKIKETTEAGVIKRRTAQHILYNYNDYLFLDYSKSDQDDFKKKYEKLTKKTKTAMRKRNNKKFNFLLWQIALVIIFICSSCHMRRNDFDGKWKIINNGMLIASVEEDKKKLDSTCTGQFVEISNSKIYGHPSYIFFGGASVLEIDSQVNVSLANIKIENYERFILTLEYLIDSSEYEGIKIYDLNVVNCPNKKYYTYKNVFALKKDLILVLADSDYLVLKKGPL